MIRFKLVAAFAAMMLVLAMAAAGFTQNKPLKKIRVGVSAVSMGNIILYVM